MIDCHAVWFAPAFQFCIWELISCLWLDDQLELFLVTTLFSSCLNLLFLVYLKQHQRFSRGGCFHLLPHQPGVLITRSGNDHTACRLVVPEHLIHWEEQEMTASQSEGSTETQRRAFYTLSSSSSKKVNKKDELVANSCNDEPNDWTFTQFPSLQSLCSALLYNTTYYIGNTPISES